MPAFSLVQPGGDEGHHLLGSVTRLKQTSEESEIMVLLHQLQSIQMIEATFKKRLGLRHLKIGDVTKNLYE